MKKNVSKVRSNLTKVMAIAGTQLLSAAVVVENAIVNVNAAGFDPVEIATDSSQWENNPFGPITKILGFFFQFLQYVGVAMAGWGVHEFSVGIREEGQAAKKMAGIYWFAGGAILFAAKFILKGIGVLA